MGIWDGFKTSANDRYLIANNENLSKFVIHKFGNAPDFDQSDGVVTVWDGADDGEAFELMNYVYSSTADIDKLSSSNAGDTVDIEIQGLDTNYERVIQTITLTGQTPVSLTTNLIRVFLMRNVGATDLLGNVFCFVDDTVTGGVPDTVSNIRAIIRIGNNQTLMANYTVPADTTGFISNFWASIASASKASNYIVDLFIRPFGEVFQIRHRNALADGGTSFFRYNYVIPDIVHEKSDIITRVRATETGITAASISAGFDIELFTT